MTRPVLAVLLTITMGVGWMSAPDRGPGDSGPRLEPAAAAAAVCPLRVERTVDGKMTVASTLFSPARVTVGSVGNVVSDLVVPVDEAGGAAVQFIELISGGAAGAFVEFGVPGAAAAAVSRGAGGVTAVSCPSLIRTTSLIPGASTRNGESLELILVNPYGSDAVVAVTSSSEIGSDSADQLSSVVVPARSTVTRDITTLLPLRNRLSFAISPIRGLVHAFTEGGGRGDRVVIEHVSPGSEWIAPVPFIPGQVATLVVSTASPVDVTLRVDGWSGGEFVEGVFSDSIPARGQLEIPLADLALDIVHVLGDGPIGVTLALEGVAGRAATPINSQGLQEWLMPGPGSAGSIGWVGVPGFDDAVVEFRSLSTGALSFTVDVPAGQVVAVPLEDQLIGYTLRSGVPITVLWTVSDETGLGLGAPTALPGGE
jgi:hypothetical protein